MADTLGMKTVFIHPFAGVLSAYGMGLADLRQIFDHSVEERLSEEILTSLDDVVFRMERDGRAQMKEQGVDDSRSR